MYQTLLVLHTYVRWLVLASLLIAIYLAYKGYVSNSRFTAKDNAIRHWTATIAHVQLMIGMVLYFQSPVVKTLGQNFTAATKIPEVSFFGLYHSLMMFTAVVIITIGSAKSKRKPTDNEKFRTMLTWFLIALLIIFIAIPWPFSPLANRPYYR